MNCDWNSIDLLWRRDVLCSKWEERNWARMSVHQSDKLKRARGMSMTTPYSSSTLQWFYSSDSSTSCDTLLGSCCSFSFLFSLNNDSWVCSCTCRLWMLQHFTTAWSITQRMARCCATAAACLCCTSQRWFSFLAQPKIPEIQIQASTCCFGLTDWASRLCDA